jgi:hypothetical protein
VQYGPSSVAAQVDPYQYLLNKGQGLSSHNLNPVFASRLSQAIQAAEAATGSKATLTDLYRSPETQAQYYANYTGRSVSFGGVRYSPQGQGGLAAAPGTSRHERGTAADVSHGPVLDWLHQHAGQFGLEFLKGSAYARDPVHVQLAGGGGRGQPSDQQPFAEPSNVAGPGYRAPASSIRSSAQPSFEGVPVQTLAQARQAKFGTELQNPNVRRLLAASTQAEVGGQGPQAEQAYIESVMNRALSRGYSLTRAIQDSRYYPQSTMSQLGHGYGPDIQGRINNLATNALQGSNVSNFATGNESGRNRSGGANIAFNPGTGERFVHELKDLKWINSLGAYTPQMRDVGTTQPRGRQYAMLDTGIRSDASPEPYEGAQYAEINPSEMSDASPDVGEEDQTPYQMAQALSPPSRGFGLSQTLSQPNIETQNLQDYVKSLNLPASPVNLQPSSIPAQVPNFAGMAPPFHSVTVTGADGNPQTINVMDAMVDPTIGMSKGAFMAPEALDRMRRGLTPTYEETTAPNFTDEELHSMSHEAQKLFSKPGMPYARRPLTAGEMAAIATLGLPIRAAQGFYHGAEEAQNTAMDVGGNPYAHGPVGDFNDTVGSSVPTQDSTWLGKALGIGPMGYSSLPEDRAAAAATEAAMNVVGARFPSATMETHALGMGGGGKFRYPIDPETGRFVPHDLPVRPRDPETGQFLPDEAIEAPPTQTVEPGKTGLSPVGQLLAEREAAKPELPPAPEAAVAPEPKLPPAPQLAPPKNRRMAGTNLRGLGLNPRAVAARKAAEEAAAAAKSPIDELNALKEKLPELSDIKPGAPGSVAPLPPAAATAPRKAPRVPIVAKPGTVGPAAHAPAPINAEIVPPPAPAWPPPGYVEVDPEMVRQSQLQPPPAPTPPAAPAPTSVPTTPRVSQTPPAPAGPQIPQTAVGNVPIPDYPATSFSPISYARMADDQTAPITSYYRKSGASYEALQRLKEILRLHTGGQASAIARAAAENGHALTPAVNFHVDTSLSEIARYAKHNPDFNDYLHAGDTLDELQAMQRNLSNRNNPQQQGLFSGLPSTTKAGPMTLHGYTEADLQKYIRDAEQLNPDFARVGELYRANIRETRRAMAEGEYATMTSKNHADANALNPNEVPQHRRDRSRGRVDAEGQPIKRPDPIAAAIDFIHRAIRKRLTNEAVGQTIHALHNNPGSRGMFRPITSAELRQSPHLLSRVVTFRRRGQYEHWLANSQTMADLLKMDPYHFASHSGTHMLDAARRLQVANTTGLMAPWFAKTDADRNWLIGQMTVGAANKGMGPGRIIPKMVMGRKLGFIPVPAFPRRPPSRYGIRQTLGLTGFPLGPGTLPWAAASQLVPRLAKHAAFSLNATSGHWMRRAFGNKVADHLATVLAGAYHRSTLAQLEARGTHSGGLMRAGENRQLQNSYIDQAIARSKAAIPGLDTSLSGARNVINAVHSMPQFAYIQRNLKHVARQIRKEMGPNATHEQVMEETLNRLHLEANDMAGDPLITGRAYTPSGSKIRYDPGAQVTGFKRFAALTAGKIAEHGWVGLNEFLRHMASWHNMTMQGAKRFPAAFVKNPTEFLARAFTYGAVPSALSYWYNTSLGTDPQGIPYVDHMMNGRTEYRKAMYHYLGIKGLPAWMGLEYPSFQELIPMKMMVEAGMDHLYGKNIWTMGQDAQAALTSTLDNAVLPPLHPLMQAVFEAAGVAAPANYGGLWPLNRMFGGMLGQNTGNVDLGGEVYVRRGDKYIDQNRPVSQIMSSTFRAIAAASADMLLAGYAAAAHTDGSLTDALENAAKATGKLVLRRTPEVGNLLGYDNPLSNNTRVTAEMMARRNAVDRINNYFNAYGVTGVGHIGHAKPISKSGEMMATAKLGQPLPPEPMGLNEPPPTNPLYLKFIQFLHARTESDSLEKGGMGYKSLWRRYNDAGADVRTLFNIDPGNQTQWEALLQTRPSAVRLLQNTGVDMKNPTAVRSYLVHEQQRAARAINDAITSVERDMSKAYGRPIKIEDLDPYNAPNMTDAANARYIDRLQQGQGQGP